MKNLPISHAGQPVPKPGAGQYSGPDVLEDILSLLPLPVNRDPDLRRLVQSFLQAPVDLPVASRELNDVRQAICCLLRWKLEPNQRESGCIFLTMLDGLRTAKEHCQLKGLDELDSFFKAHQADFAGRLFDGPVQDARRNRTKGSGKTS